MLSDWRDYLISIQKEMSEMIQSREVREMILQEK